MLIGVAAGSFLFSGCFGGCGDLGGKAAELALEKATGVEIETDSDGGVKLKTKDGEIAVAGNETDGIQFKGKDGEEVHFGGTSAKAPKDFPLSLMEGSQIVTSASSAKAGEQEFIVMTQLPATTDLEKIVAFYEAEIEAKGCKGERSEFTMNDVTMIVLTGRSDGGPTCNVTVTHNPANEEAERVGVTVNWTQRKN